MRTTLLAFLCAASALGTLHFGSSAAVAAGPIFSGLKVDHRASDKAHIGWRRSYRRPGSYAPLHRRHHYRPPAVVVVPPPVSYHPRPRRIFRRDCRRGYIYGPAGTYYPKYGHRHHSFYWD